MVFITGDRIGGGDSVDWRAVSSSTVSSFRQNIKVLQQLFGAQEIEVWAETGSRGVIAAAREVDPTLSASCKPCILIMILTNQHFWHIVFLCTVSRLCTYSPNGQIGSSKGPCFENVAKSYD